MNEKKERTIAKTYCFFSTDIERIVEGGHTPKSILRLGVLALDNNPQMIARIRELETGNDKLQKQLTRLSSRLWEGLEKNEKKFISSEKFRPGVYHSR